jgi:iron-sulfur cluster repair protein YtfE (RIC family)
LSQEDDPMPESLAQLFTEDHRRLDAILVEAKQALRAGDLARGAARFSEFRAGLERHIVAEEEVLFPMFETAGGPAACGPTRVMRLEHGEIRSLMAEISTGLERGGDDARGIPMAALTARIYAHNGKEERILYPAIEKVAVESDALEALLSRVQLPL